MNEPMDQRIPLVTTRAQFRAIDAWRRRQDDLPSRSEAIRRLIERGLKAGPAGDARIELVEDNGIGVTLRRQPGDEGRQ
jgi:hypothetical protein